MVAAITIIVNFFIEVTIKELKEKLKEFEEKTDEKLLVFQISTAAFINLLWVLEDSGSFIFWYQYVNDNSSLVMSRVLRLR